MGRSRKMKLRLVALVAAFTASTLLPISPVRAQSSIESCFVSKINASRSGSLSVHGDLVGVARRHSARMASSGTIYHNGSLPSQAPAGWQSLGENVGMGPSCDSIHQAFMNSSSHRHNIQDPDFNFVGVGVVVAEDGTIFVTEVFMQKEASQPAQSAPAPSKASGSSGGGSSRPRSTGSTRPRTTSAPAAAAPAPPPPPPPPPGSFVNGKTRSYFGTGILDSEYVPNKGEQKAYRALLKEQKERRAELRRLERLMKNEEHNFFSQLSAYISGALAGTV